MIVQIEREWEQAIAWACQQAELETLARKDALRDMAKGIPDPKQYAFELPLACVTILLAATLVGKQGRGIFKVAEHDAQFIRPYGLCDYASTCLTAFGMNVRRALLEEDA